MFKDNEKRKRLMEQRKTHLLMMTAVLNHYKKNKDESYIEFVKWLGGITSKMKEELDTND